MKRPHRIRVGSARILRALAGILPDSVSDKPRVELSRAWKAYHAHKSPGRMPAEAGWKPALPERKRA